MPGLWSGLGVRPGSAWTSHTCWVQMAREWKQTGGALSPSPFSLFFPVSPGTLGTDQRCLRRSWRQKHRLGPQQGGGAGGDPRPRGRRWGQFEPLWVGVSASIPGHPFPRAPRAPGVIGPLCHRPHVGPAHPLCPLQALVLALQGSLRSVPDLLPHSPGPRHFPLASCGHLPAVAPQPRDRTLCPQD